MAFYVATTGNDTTGDGSVGNPWRTITKGLSALPDVGAGELEIAGGTYDEAEIRRFIRGGTSWAAKWWIHAAAGATVIVKRSTSITRLMNIEGGFYQEWERIIFDGTNATSDCVKVAESGATLAHHIRFRECTFRNTVGFGIILVAGTSFCELIDCISHNNGSNDSTHGVYWQGSDGLIQGGEYYSNAGYGIHMYYTGGSGVNNNVIVGVIAHDNNTSGGNGANFIIAAGSNWIKNCLAYGGERGIQVYGTSVDGRISHCTVYGHTDVGIRIDAGAQDTLIEHCLIHGNTTNTVANSGTNTVQTNNYIGGSDPLFVNAGAHDFHLQAGSPALAIAARLADVLDDLEGTLRDAQADAGAYERTSTPVAFPDPLRRRTPLMALLAR